MLLKRVLILDQLRVLAFGLCLCIYRLFPFVLDRLQILQPILHPLRIRRTLQRVQRTLQRLPARISHVGEEDVHDFLGRPHAFDNPPLLLRKRVLSPRTLVRAFQFQNVIKLRLQFVHVFLNRLKAFRLASQLTFLLVVISPQPAIVRLLPGPFVKIGEGALQRVKRRIPRSKGAAALLPGIFQHFGRGGDFLDLRADAVGLSGFNVVNPPGLRPEDRV